MKKKRINFRRFFITLFILYAAATIINQQIQISRLKDKHQEIESRIQKIQGENEKLKAMINYTNTDEYLEKMAREQLGLVKPGETIYVDQSKQQDNLQEGGN